MKKMLYLILPALFLATGANFAFAQNKEIKTLTPEEKARFEEQKQKLEEQRQQTDSLRQQIEAQKNTLESSFKALTLEPKRSWALPENDLLKAKKITAGEKINLQGMLFNEENKETAEPKYYKLKLDENAKYVLLDPKTSKESEQNSVSWVWNDFLGKYEYEFNFKLVFPQTRNSYLLIKITPVLSKDNEPTLPIIHIAFNFTEKGDIVYGGHVRDIESHHGFQSKALAKKIK